MPEEIIGSKKDVVYIGVNKKYNDDYIYVRLNGFQTMGTKITPKVARELIPLLEKYLQEK